EWLQKNRLPVAAAAYPSRLARGANIFRRRIPRLNADPAGAQVRVLDEDAAPTFELVQGAADPRVLSVRVSEFEVFTGSDGIQVGFGWGCRTEGRRCSLRDFSHCRAWKVARENFLVSDAETGHCIRSGLTQSDPVPQAVPPEHHRVTAVLDCVE